MIHSHCKRLKKSIAVMVMGLFLLHVSMVSDLLAQSVDEIIKQFRIARDQYNHGQYVNAMVRIERVISLSLENKALTHVLGECYLLMGAIYEKQDKPLLAEENYCKARDTYHITSVESVDLSSLALYRKFVSGEKVPPKGTIEKPGIKKKKKFPWLLVAGGVVVVGIAVYFLFLKPKKQYRLEVSLGEGVDGEPGTGTYTHKKGTRLNYDYTLKAGYSNLVVTLDGTNAAESGTIEMNRDHRLTAAASANVVSFVTDKERVEIPEGGTATFNVRLTAQPKSDINVTVSRLEGGDDDIRLLAGESLTFTPSNWNNFQTVVLQAVEDLDAVNGEATIRIRAPDNPEITPLDITAVEIDNDILIFITDTDRVSINEGKTKSFQVKLSAAPTADVVADVSWVSGDVDIIVRSPGFTFTHSNWNIYQKVTLKAREDEDAENGNATIRISAPGVTNKDITAVEIDNDSLNFITDTDNVSVEEGKTAAFQVKLSAQPSADVTAAVNRVGGDSDITVDNGSTLNFTRDNWNSYQTVTLKASEDADTGNGEAEIRISAPGITDKDITAAEVDNDSLNFITDTNSVIIPEGSTAVFQVKLSAKPPADVTAAISKVPGGDRDITIQPPRSLTFTTADWDIYQTVTLAAAGDEDNENGQAIIRITAAGIPSKEITATENDTGTGDPPQVSIYEPREGALIPEDVTIVAVASDDFGIQRVEFYIGQEFKYADTVSPYEYEWSTREVSVGPHTIKVIAYDAIDQKAEDYRTVTVIDEPPTELTLKVSPDQTPASGTVEITAAAADYRGVRRIEVYLGSELLTSWNEGPESTVNFKFNLDTTQYENGDHVLKAVASDTADQKKEEEITLSIQNPTGR